MYKYYYDMFLSDENRIKELLGFVNDTYWKENYCIDMFIHHSWFTLLYFTLAYFVTFIIIFGIYKEFN